MTSRLLNSIPRLRPVEQGNGKVEDTQDGVRLSVLPTSPGKYSNAQFDDYAGLPRSRFAWRPPLRLRLRARASGADLPGTFGFGFWNDPFAFSGGLVTGRGLQFPAAPNCAWFFYGSPPNDFSILTGDLSPGWKAMILSASPRLIDHLVGPAAAAATVLAGCFGLTPPRLHNVVRRWVRGQVSPVDPPDEWRDYGIEWTSDRVRLLVDEQAILESPHSPKGPLGFVAWIDNQFAAVSPTGTIRFGVLPVLELQWLEISHLEIET